ncbi:hypothetical protein CDCA_CDCA16G4295 [Cyanidium caldarium]|uniref:t-SNARE coiled-coil homology domain-containing protein n=1 Tax=Cyanidium caldarium TaxID=2771 RepID=A0AAV9J1R9_CYACA|nr:hypothetical protein CDCA_CDCA16G4295 [Cyanidium caldarium]
MDRLTELRGSGRDVAEGGVEDGVAAGGGGDIETGATASAAPGAGAASAAVGRSDDSERMNIFDRWEAGLASLQEGVVRRLRGQRRPLPTPVAEEAAAGARDPTLPKLSRFYEHVDVIKAQLADFVTETAAIRSAHRAMVEDPTRSRRPPDTSRARSLAVGIKQKLDSIKSDEQRLAAADDEQGSLSAEVRIYAGTHAALSRRFMGALKEFQQLQRECDQQMREQAERELRIIDPSITHEQTETLLEQAGAGAGGGEFLRQQMLHATDYDYEQVRVVARDMEERAAALRELEAGMEQLRDIFLDMSVLVESQGETMDQIEKNVAAAKLSTKRGVRQLRSARRKQRGYYRLMFCAFYCVIILLVVILVPVLVTTLRTSNSGG